MAAAYNPENLATIAAGLVNAKKDLDARITLAHGIKDMMDMSNAMRSATFVEIMLPAILDVLLTFEPVMISKSQENHFRVILIDLLYKFPMNDALKPHIGKFADTCLFIMRRDNEENAVTALRILMDLQKVYRNQTEMENRVEATFDFVEALLQNTQVLAKELFDDSDIDMATDEEKPPSGKSGNDVADNMSSTQEGSLLEEQEAKVLRPGEQSFKMLGESPMIVALFYQIYKNGYPRILPKIVPQYIKILSYQARLQEAAQADAKAENTFFMGIAPNIPNRHLYVQLFESQVRTFWILAQLLRVVGSTYIDQATSISNALVNLLMSCPSDLFALRRILLESTRQICCQDLRMTFVPLMDVLLREETLMGTRETNKQYLRALASSALADVAHQIRDKLTVEQISKIIYMYSQNMHDNTLEPKIQTMSAKLLLNLSDPIVSIPDRTVGRKFLIRLLQTFMDKFRGLQMTFSSVLNTVKEERKKYDREAIAADPMGVLRSMLKAVNLHYEDVISPIKVHQQSTDFNVDLIKDYKFLFKTLITALKTFIFAVGRCSPELQPRANEQGEMVAPAATHQKVPFKLDEIDMFHRIFRDVLSGFDIFTLDQIVTMLPLEKNHAEFTHYQMMLQKEEKEALDVFSSIWTYVDSAAFQEVMLTEMDFLFQRILYNNNMVSVPQFLLGNEPVTQGFSGAMFRFLMGKLDELGNLTDRESTVLTRLFKLGFMAVGLYPALNEEVLQPHIAELITSALKRAHTSKNPNCYFTLLRALFRSIGGGKFESLYKEVLPLLPSLLEGFNALLDAAYHPQMKELFVELILTVPVRLSVLLPFLHYLMRPLVIALDAGPDLVNQGLRTLELCVDNLTSDFLDPLLHPVREQLTKALYKHLKPLPYSVVHSHTTLRILGKLGGRNRKYLPLIQELEMAGGLSTLSSQPSQQIASSTLSEEFSGASTSVTLELKVDGASRAEPVVLAMDAAILKAAAIMQDTSAPSLKRLEVFPFIKSCLLTFLDIHGPVNMDQCLALLGPRLHPATTPSSASSAASSNVPSSATSPTAASSSMATAPLASIQAHKERREKLTKHYRSVNALTITSLQQQDQLCVQLLLALLTATTHEELLPEAADLAALMTSHFALLITCHALKLDRHSVEDRHAASSLQIIKSVDPSHVFAMDGTLWTTAMVEAMTSEKETWRQAAFDQVHAMYGHLTALFPDVDTVSKLPVFQSMASKIASACYMPETYRRVGACASIALLTSKMDLGLSFLLDREIDFLRAMLYVLKDAPGDALPVSHADINPTILHLIKTCHRAEHSEEFKEKRHAKFQLVRNLLITELSSPSTFVRSIVQTSIQLLADVKGDELIEILQPVKERLLAPIFAKPLRALPFAMQIGHIEAVTYCLDRSLRPPLLTFNDELIRLLKEVHALAKADDAEWTSKNSQHKTAPSLSKLRVVSIKLLAAAMVCPEFNQVQHAALRTNIIQIYFKWIYFKHPDIVDAAKKGLSDVLGQHSKAKISFPKELLTTGLRPVLANLTDFKKITIEGLEGLGRLLELLTSYFKPEIGRKLLEHINIWSEELRLDDKPGLLLNDRNEIRKMAAILDVFHHLPPAASIFLGPLLEWAVRMDVLLRRAGTNPFRGPVLKFCTKCPVEAVDAFAKNIGNDAYARLLAAFLTMPGSEILQIEVLKHAMDFVRATLSDQDDPHFARRYRGVEIVQALSSSHPEWLTSNTELMSILRHLWHQSFSYLQNGQEEAAPETAIRLPQKLANVFLTYFFERSDEFGCLFELMRVYTIRSRLDYSFVRAAVQKQITETYDAKARRDLLTFFFDDFYVSNASDALKVAAIRMLVIPVLKISLDRDEFQLVVTEQIITSVVDKLWRPLLDEVNIAGMHDTLRIEILQLSAFFLQHASDVFKEKQRASVIKWAWPFIKLEDQISKYAAFVLICIFIDKEETTPSDIVSRIFSALLRAKPHESRLLVKQALDSLAPALPKRLPGPPGDEPWIRYTRRVLNEDGRSLQETIAVWQYVIRQPELFFSARHDLGKGIIGLITRLGLSVGTSNEFRSIAIDMVQLILKWEVMRRDNTASEAVCGKDMAHGCREAVLAFLVRYACTVSEPPIKRSSSQRCIDLLRQLLDHDVWQKVPISLAPFEKLFETTEISDATSTLLCNAFHVLSLLTQKHLTLFTSSPRSPSPDVAVLGMAKNSNEMQVDTPALSKTDSGVAQNLKAMLVRFVTMDDRRLVDAYCALVTAMIKKEEEQKENAPSLSQSQHDASLAFKLIHKISDVLMTGRSSLVCLETVRAIGAIRSDLIHLCVPSLVKLLQTVVKETGPNASSASGSASNTVGASAGANRTGGAVAAGTSSSTGGGAQGRSAHGVLDHLAGAATTNDGPIRMVVLLLTILRDLVPVIGETRKVILSSMVTLVEKSNDGELHALLLEMAKEWVHKSNETFPTIKEKAVLLAKMMAYHQQHHALPSSTSSSTGGGAQSKLWNDFLHLVADIYATEAYKRTDLTFKLESAFLAGTVHPDAALRQRFLLLLDNSIPRQVSARINYILCVQNWEHLSHTFWIHQAAHILLGAFAQSSCQMRLIRPHSVHHLLHLAQPSVPTKSAPEKRSGSASSRRAKHHDTTAADDEQLKSVLTTYCHHVQKVLAPMSPAEMQSDAVISFPLLHDYRRLLYADHDLVAAHWPLLWKTLWSLLAEKEAIDGTRYLSQLLAQEYHVKQMHLRPNPIQVLMRGVSLCRSPPILLPPALVRYLGKTYDAWHTAIEILHHVMPDVRPIDPSLNLNEDEKMKEAALDSLADLYTQLNEQDMLYGLWKRRCMFPETSAAISFAQAGRFADAQATLEFAQVKARNGQLPFTEPEYIFWEDQWVHCATQLQQWHALHDVAKGQDLDLQLECAWRLSDWREEQQSIGQLLQQVTDTSALTTTPRRKLFQSFDLLTQLQTDPSKLRDFSSACEVGIQLTLQKWSSLPTLAMPAQTHLLQTFQHFVEMSEAQSMFQALLQNAAHPKQAIIQDIKGLLNLWRDRLPNVWENINVWGELVAWRQHVFHAINKAHQALTPVEQRALASFAFRGFHEIAWIINRFAHVARKHGSTDVCIQSLSKIYTLPNIEISDAFLKLKEQAKCYYQSTTPEEVVQGLEVINNTNLSYFQPAERAEFFAMKGIFLSQLGHVTEADTTFVNALQIDMNVPKAWATWGRFHDSLHKQHPLTDTTHAKHALSCYLQASELYKNDRSRTMLGRVLWFLGLEDASNQIKGAFDGYKGDNPVYFWIPYIPQLLSALSRHEAPYALTILSKISKQFPQALYYHVRALRHDVSQQQQQQHARSQLRSATTSSQQNKEEEDASNKVPKKVTRHSVKQRSEDETMEEEDDEEQKEKEEEDAMEDSDKEEEDADLMTPPEEAEKKEEQVPSSGIKRVSDHLDMLQSLMKTAHALLCFSMETMCEQIVSKIRPTMHDEMSRLMNGLLNDALTISMEQWQRYNTGEGDAVVRDPDAIPQSTRLLLQKVYDELIVRSKFKHAFAADFLQTPTTMTVLIQRYKTWKDRLDLSLRTKQTTKQSLEHLSHFLIEFNYTKYDDIDVPGQYDTAFLQPMTSYTAVTPTTTTSAANAAPAPAPSAAPVPAPNGTSTAPTGAANNTAATTATAAAAPPSSSASSSTSSSSMVIRPEFIRIDRFLPEVQHKKVNGILCRIITIRGHDGSLHPFCVQSGAGPNNAREMRFLQLFRSLNSIMERKVTTRRRQCHFYVPSIIPLSAKCRLVQYSGPCLTLNDVAEQHAHQERTNPLDPYTHCLSRLQAAAREKGSALTPVEEINIKTHLLEEISQKYVPRDTLRSTFAELFQSASAMYTFKTQFARQMAAFSYLTYAFAIGQRLPTRMYITNKTGNVFSSDFYPLINGQFKLSSSEVVPFRLSPNVQDMMGAEATEGIFISTIQAIGHALTDTKGELEDLLALFIRDEMIAWAHQLGKSNEMTDARLREFTLANMTRIVDRTALLSCRAPSPDYAGIIANASTGGATSPQLMQPILDLVADATNPVKLAAMDMSWAPWL